MCHGFFFLLYTTLGAGLGLNGWGVCVLITSFLLSPRYCGCLEGASERCLLHLFYKLHSLVSGYCNDIIPSSCFCLVPEELADVGT